MEHISLAHTTQPASTHGIDKECRINLLLVYVTYSMSNVDDGYRFRGDVDPSTPNAQIPLNQTCTHPVAGERHFATSKPRASMALQGQ